MVTALVQVTMLGATLSVVTYAVRTALADRREARLTQTQTKLRTRAGDED